MRWTFLTLKTDSDLIYLLEALKVEGYWSLKNMDASIQNKNILFLKHIERILKKYNINFSKRLLIKIKPKNQNFSKKDIRLITGNKEIKLHIEHSIFDKTKKIVFNLPFYISQNIFLFLKNKQVKIIVKVGKENIEIKSPFSSFGYIGLRFHNSKFIRFIDNYAGEKGSSKIRLNRFLFNVSEKLVAPAFSAVIDSEASIDYYGHTRRIRIRMKNLDYLKDWKKLLDKFKIHSHIIKEKHLYTLIITGLEDFNKILKLGVKLYHSKKRKKFEMILNSYQRNQISRNTWKEFYIRKLKEVGKPISADEFAKTLGKSKRVTNHYLTKLDRENLIRVNKSKITYFYSAK